MTESLRNKMRKYVVEFVGTFFLVLLVIMTINNGTGNLAPVAIGLGLMGLIYAGGHVSKAHYNPAVTVAFYWSGKMHVSDLLPYILAQFAGSGLAILLGSYLLQHTVGLNLEAQVPQFEVVPTLVAEFIGTFLLITVILQVAVAKGLEGNSIYGLAIGATVTGLAYMFGPVSGGAFNPAVVAAVNSTDGVQWLDINWYILASVFAAGAAAIAFRVLEIKD